MQRGSDPHKIEQWQVDEPFCEEESDEASCSIADDGTLVVALLKLQIGSAEKAGLL